jgi:mRNA interferase MazF
LDLAKAPGNVLLEKNDTSLPKSSVVNISQIITLDKSFLTECIGTLNKRLLEKVENGIRLVLEI